MPFDKFRAYIEDQGFCCPWAILTVKKSTPTSEITVEAGMTPRALRFWRQAFRAGELKCENCKACLQKKVTPSPGKTR